MTTLNITSPNGEKFRVNVPDGVDPATAAEQFGKDMGWAPGGNEKSDIADTAAVTAGAFQKGARTGGNPLNMIAGMGRFTEDSVAAMPVQAAAFKALGLKPSDVGDWAQRNAPSMDPLRYWDANPMTRAAGKALYGHDPATALKDTESAYKATGAEITPLRDFLTGAAEIAGEQIPALAAGPMKGALALMGASAGLGGLGNVVGGETGQRIGSIAALGLPLALRAGQSGYNAVSGAARPLRPQGRQDIAEAIVRESATDPAAASTALANRPPLPNAGFTAAEMSGDRGLLSLQRAYMGRPGTVTGGEYAGAQIPDAFIAARSNQNEAMNRLMGRMRPYGNTDEASIGLSNAMRRDTFEPVIRDERRAWDSFRQSSGNQVFDADPLQAAWNNLRRQPNIRPDRDLVPAREYNKLRSIFERGATDLDELQSIRSGLGDARQAALRAGENNRARVIEAHRRVLTDYINNLPVRDPATLGLYQGARNMTRAKNVAFTDSNIGKAFERTGQNYDLRATKVADTAFSSREAFNDAMRLGQANPNITRELRRNFVTRLMESARTTATDLPTGERVLSRAAMDRFLADPVMQHARARLYDTPAKERIWNRVEDALTRMDATNRAKPGVGSNTSHDLQRGAVLDGLVMRLSGKLTGGAADTIVNRFTKALLSTSIQEIEGMVANILLNPAAARVALTRPTPGNFQLLRQVSRSRPYLAPVAGALSAQ